MELRLGCLPSRTRVVRVAHVRCQLFLSQRRAITQRKNSKKRGVLRTISHDPSRRDHAKTHTGTTPKATQNQTKTSTLESGASKHLPLTHPSVRQLCLSLSISLAVDSFDAFNELSFSRHSSFVVALYFCSLSLSLSLVLSRTLTDGLSPSPPTNNTALSKNIETNAYSTNILCKPHSNRLGKNIQTRTCSDTPTITKHAQSLTRFQTDQQYH